MGYYTDYKIERDGSSNLTDIETMCQQLEKISDYSFEPEGSHEISCNHSKWYDHEENMREFSKLYPEVVFTVTGEGEEGGDLWKRYYKNGKMQAAHAEIIFPPFDESKLE